MNRTPTLTGHGPWNARWGTVGMQRLSAHLVRAYWLVTAALFVAVILMLVLYTPVDRGMGPVQKIFYLHLPVAISGFLAAFVVFIASVGYLWSRSMWWDDLAAAAGKVAVLYCAVILLTGMFWGRSAWGVWWTWSPRLTFSLVLFLLYAVYVLIRPTIDSAERRAVICAVYGIIAFLDVPLVYLSVRLIPDIHPSSISLEPAMRLSLLAWFPPVVMLMAGMIGTRYALNRRLRSAEAGRFSEAPSAGAAIRVSAAGGHP
ncbi:MAG: cytochrome c biogenesis protein CcsA [Phycisphaeraceae bacterium]|nr:cytochrome c biogenesis protein CcsA [Phycisphaeraceae bacterium]